MNLLKRLFGRHKKPQPPPPPVITKPVKHPKPVPVPPPPPPLQRYIGLNLVNFTSFSGVPGVMDATKQIYAGLTADGGKPVGRIPGGTEANRFNPATVQADADDLVLQVANLKTLGASAIIVINQYDGSSADDIAMLDECHRQGVEVLGVEANEIYLGKYHPPGTEVEDMVADYMDEAAARCAYIKSQYPGTRFGLVIMPIAGMRDTNNTDRPEVALDKSNTWNAVVLAATFGDYFEQHVYPDGQFLADAVNAIASQDYGKPIWITETNASGTQDQQAQWVDLLMDALPAMPNVPVVVFHSGPTGGNKWTALKVSGGSFKFTPFGQAMKDRKK
jgi:hypothetical protein